MSLVLPSFLQTASPQRLALLTLSVVGFRAVLRIAFCFLVWTWHYFLRPGKNLSKYGSWAIVTGCTDGIGKGFCFQLAKRGLNLLLVGRSQDKLETLISQIRTKHPKVQVQFVVLDFLDPEVEGGLSKIQSLVWELDVGILINSAGLSYPYARFFHEVDAELMANIIRLNVQVIVRMVQLVLPAMLKKKRGAIVNIGSGSASILPSDPLYALYAGTKGFIEKFSRNLYVEYKQNGIDVQVQVPLHVATKLASIRKPSFFAPSADAYARSGIRWIGYEPLCCPYWSHSLLWKLVEILPSSLVDSMRLRMCMDVCRRGKLKEARKKEQ